MNARALLLSSALAVVSCTARQSRPPPPREEASVESLTLAPAEVEALSAAWLQAGASLGKGDFAGAASSLRRALEVNPGDDSLVYDIAAFSAQAGRTEEALSWLERLVTMRSHLVPQDRDFPGLQGERYQRVIEALRRHTPAARSATAFLLPENDLIPEGIAYDPETGSFFIGSLHKRKVVSIDAGGLPSDFATAKDQGLDSVLGMRVDPERHVLWVNTAATPTMQGFDESLRGRSTLHKLDLATGRQLARFPRGPGGQHLLNDIALAPNGDLFLTDSESGEVLKLRADAPEGTPFEVLVPPGKLFYPNGLTLSDDGRILFVADFANGLTAIRLDTGERFTLAHPRGASTRGLDGLYFHQDSLVAVQNGVGPGRIVRFVLSEKLDRIVRVELLESNHPLFRIPTTGALVGDALYLVANSQLRGLGTDGKYLPPEQLEPVVILRVPLSSED